MAWTEDSLLIRARTSYELGRLRRTVRDSWMVVPIIAIGAVCQSNASLVFAAGATLFAITTVLSWRGQFWGRAVWPGFLAGAAPLLIPSLAPAKAVCWIGGSCWSLCILLCPLSGLIAGLAVGFLATRQREGGLRFLAASALVAGITGAIGCALAGFLGIAGMITGGFLGLVPIYLGAQLRRA